MSRPWLLVGNEENRRVQGFVAALREAGQDLLGVVPWAAVVADPGVLSRTPDRELWLRIDAAGESDVVARALLARGDPERFGAGVEVPWELGELVHPGTVHRGFVHVLEEISAVLATRPLWAPIVHPDAVIRAFDKRRCHAEHAAAGIRVPEGLGPAGSAGDLFAAMEERGWDQVYVKLNCGSSASGLAVVRGGPAPVARTTTWRRRDGRRFNRLEVQRVSGSALVDLLDWLLAEGAHVERSIPKERLEQAFFDCRVLVIAGEPAFVVVRQSRHPITNLHLGGWRGDLSALRAACPASAWDAAMEDCARVAARHGGLHAGVDVMFEPAYAGHRILEVNAFGDLLPGLLRDGLSVYGWQIARAAGWWDGRNRPAAA